jgi:hypothetical protein
LYYFHRSQWRLAWRFLGNISRIILELGLNRHIVLNFSFPDPAIRAQVVKTIWAVFVLEQQLSYSLGLSVAMPDLCLDQDFPEPVSLSVWTKAAKLITLMVRPMHHI